jgi:hypothetical protein
MIHLYHLHPRGAKALDIDVGFGLCGVKVERKQLTIKSDDCTCKQCKTCLKDLTNAAKRALNKSPT